jgi:sulfonate transport system substrate-binding protein
LSGIVRPQPLPILPPEVPEPMSVSPLRRSRLVALLTLALTCATAWVGGTAGPAAAQRSTSKIPAGTVLNVGDQDQELETLFQYSGVAKAAPFKINFVEFDSGPLVNAGFAAKQIDVGDMGDLPASLAVQSGLPVKAVAVDLPIGASEYLLAKPGITKISQLRGKPVAYTTGTAEQAFALRALATAGLTQKDVQQVNVSLQQLGTALESGSADASVVSVEQKVDYQESAPTAKVLATVESVSPPSYGYLLGTTAALADPAKLAAIDDFTKYLVGAFNWAKTHQSQFINDYYVSVEHQTPAAAKQILAAGGTVNFVPITSGVQSALQTVVKLLVGAGAISSYYSVSPLFSQTESTRYNALLKEVPQT